MGACTVGLPSVFGRWHSPFQRAVCCSWWNCRVRKHMQAWIPSTVHQLKAWRKVGWL